MRRMPLSIAAGMFLSVGFFSYAWTESEHFVLPILPGGFVAEKIGHLLHSPVWINQTLFFVVNGVIWGALVFGTWSGIAWLCHRGAGRAA